MRIMVTGCAGFIGSHVCERLLEDGMEVIGIDNFDPFYSREVKSRNIKGLLRNPLFSLKEFCITDKMAFLTIDEPVDAIIHLAAKAGVRPSIADPKAYIDTNITGTLNVAEFAANRYIKKVIFASSSSVYGNAATAPFKESAVSDAPISPYAFTKKACELVLYNFFHLYKVSSICLRFFTVYGPRQRPDLAINKFFTAIQSGKQIDIYGDGSMARDYTFITDTVDGIMAALDHIINNDPVFEVVNLGNSKPFTILALVHAIEQVTGVKANLNFTQEQPGDVQVTCADIVKAGQLLGYNPKVKLLEGLEKYYQWTLNEQTKHAEATR